jgi:hypothetical protein
MMKVLSITIVYLFLCSISFAASITKDSTRRDSMVERDGSSFNKAVIIKETNEGDGITAEYKWLADHYPGYSSEGQGLSEYDKHPYDILHIKTTYGKKVDVYFDITSYFGKW